MSIGTPLRSRLDTKSDDYQQNLAQMQALWDEVAGLMASVPTIGGQRYVDRHRQRGKMLVRERIEALVDPDTPFLVSGWCRASAWSKASSVRLRAPT
jgi:acyl-CoA carboxylase subunit beta